jgi:hypothetical protein
MALNNTKARAVVQAGLRRDIKEMFRLMAVEIDVLLQAYERRNADLKRVKSDVLAEIGKIVSRYFVDPSDGRSSFARDGVTAVTPFARILNKWYVVATRNEVLAHYAFLKSRLPDDVFVYLAGSNSRPVREAVIPVDGDDFMAMIKGFRIFGNRQLEYDPMHLWVDPEGYQLSDRIWQADQRTRKAIDALTSRAIQDGIGHLKLSRMLERFLVPERAAVRTKYRGSTDASFDAMRLARTEIARASNHAAYASAYLNPMVTGIDVARSGNGDPNCPICPKHATIDISGQRVKEPYHIEKAIIPPFHPQDMCNTQMVTGDTKEIVALLRESINRRLVPYTNPTSPNRLLQQLLGPVLFAWMTGELQLNG